MWRRSILGLVAFLLAACVWGQEAEASRKEKRARKIEEGRFMAFPIAAPAYTPELGPTLIGAMMISFKTDRSDTVVQRSSTPVNIGISTRGSYFLNSLVSTYWLEDRLRIFGEVRFRDTPDHYWGVGYDKASAHPERDETTSYTRSYWRLNPRILWQFRPGYFLGLNVDYNRTLARDINDFMALDPDFLVTGPVNFNSGLGLILRYDSRDIPVNARSGMLIDIQGIIYSPWLGGHNSFSWLQLDLRKFVKVLRHGSTLALQVKSRVSFGGVPWTDLSFLGSQYDLRGYYLGHFRDRSMVLGLAEYRHQFLHRDGSLSRHGLVGWLGGGSVGTTPLDLTAWLPNAGLGYRFEVQPRMNVRVDFGFGKNTRGFYISFNEAF